MINYFIFIKDNMANYVEIFTNIRFNSSFSKTLKKV